MASIRKLADGRWQAQLRPIPGGKQITRTTSRKADAQRWLDEQQALLVTGHFVAPSSSRIMFSAFFEQWSARQIWVVSTGQAMRRTARMSPFWDMQLGLIRRSHVEAWVKSMQTAKTHAGQDSGLAPSTIKHYFSQVRTIFRAAVTDRRITSDPTAGVKLPRARRAQTSMVLPTIGQIRALLDVSGAELRLFISLCAFAGLRRGEALALKATDVDFGSGTLSVLRQVQHLADGTIEIRPPKYGSERIVGLPAELLRMLSTQVAAYPARGREPWVFPGRDGQPIQEYIMSNRWRKARRHAEAGGVRVHDLRHFFASGLIAAGCDVVAVQRALGHANATITLNTYTHLWPKAEDRARVAASAMLAEVLQLSDE